MKVAAYVAQRIRSIADSYDGVKFNEDIRKLQEPMAIAKQKAKESPGRS
ncbi:hypothetical protein KEJ19_04520 [Candidatus Bathyarchaeota archaeon]|nr:hypothetical protein [Candidatus Bathyarchaeota archaeon]